MKWSEELEYMRRSSNISLEEAAKHLMCSVEELKAYEAGEKIPDDVTVGRIWKYYKGVVIR